MARLAIIGTPRTEYVLAESIIQARLRGLDVALLDAPSGLDRCPAHLPLAERIRLDAADAGRAVEALGPFDPQLVVSFSEFNLLLAAEVRDRLGLAGPTADAVRLTRCKHETRRRLNQCGLSQVAFEVTTLAELEETAKRFEPPFIVKPASMTGSIGVHAVLRWEDLAAFRARFVDPQAEEAGRRQLIVEQYIGGDEYSVEGICCSGAFHLLAVTAKRTNGPPNFAETGHTLPARPRGDANFGGFVGAVAAALGIDAAPIHAEVKVLDGRIELIEIHTRFGGDHIPLLIEKAFGISPFGAYYDVLLGGGPPAPRRHLAVAGIQFLHAEDLGRLGRFPRVFPGLDYDLRVEGRGAPEAALDNIRILNRRIAHVIFSAPDHDAADAFVESLAGRDGSLRPRKADADPGVRAEGMRA
jgi:hypothetical protein